METFIRKVHYYETDQMGIVHHSNYIRWFEEARIDWLDKIGLSFVKLEKMGLFSPVLKVECEYKKPFRFGDKVYIDVYLVEISNIKFKINYIVRNEDEAICAKGETSHCFINNDGKPISLKRTHPELFHVLIKNIMKDDKI